MARRKPVVDSLDLDSVLARIECGESQAEIAKSLGVSQPSISRLLDSDENRSARAMLRSAESWLDRGLDALQSAPADQAEIARARAIEQHCARRAAIRNPKYRDKQEHTIAGDPDRPVIHTIERRIVKPVDNSGGNL